MADLPKPATVIEPDHETVLRRQEAFGYTTEDMKVLVGPMATDGVEPTGSMGTDTPLAVLSNRPQLLYNYFKQLFAQVTNPPVDAIREEIIMAVDTAIGPEGNLLEPTPASARQIELATPGAAERGAREAAQPRRRAAVARLQARHHPDAVRRRRAAVTGSRPASRRCARRPARPSPTATTSSSCPTAGTTTTARPSRRCWRSRRCSTTCCARARAPASAWSSRAASRARSTTSRCCWATAPAPSIRTWRSSRCTT